jgi:Rho termination factor, N-terminal domain.
MEERMKITNGKQILDVTKGVFEQDYKTLGYEPFKEGETKDNITSTEELEDNTVDELKALAKQKGIENYNKMKKTDLIDALKERD